MNKVIKTSHDITYGNLDQKMFELREVIGHMEFLVDNNPNNLNLNLRDDMGNRYFGRTDWGIHTCF